MTFNIDDTNRFDYDVFWAKVVNELIIPYKIDLALFQEVDYDCDPPQYPDEDKPPDRGGNGCNREARNEEEYLIKELQKHPELSSYKVIRLFRRMIMSKFDILTEDSPALNPGRNTPRFQSVVINSPSGPLRVFNFHWPGSCGANLDGFSISIDRFTDQPFIMGGDFNINYYDGAPIKMKNGVAVDDRTLCFNRIRNNFTISHPPNQTDEVIDYIMAPKNSGWEVSQTDNRIFTWKKDGWSDHNPVIATLRYVGANAAATATPTPTSTPTPVAAIVAGGTVIISPTTPQTNLQSRQQLLPNYNANQWLDLMYYVFFSLSYLTLMRFGFYIHRFFSFFLLTIVFVAGAGVTFAFGWPAGIFVVIIGSFAIMMQ
jgi:endonuclease/exonuclease/phosphatase family metal-dependent hydrolase